VAAADLVANQLVTAVKRSLFGEKGKTVWDNTVFDSVKSRFWGDTQDPFYVEHRQAAGRIEAG
jgi:hypothetical protein